MRDAIRSMVHDTEREIFNFAVDLPEEEENRDLNDEDIEDMDLAEIEGFDGKPLYADEQFATTIYGHPDTGLDRPIAYAEELAEQSENARLRQQLERERDARARDIVQFDPQIQAGLQEERERENYEIMNNPDAARQHIYRQQQENELLQQYVGKQQEARVNENMAAYAQEYGDDFKTAYDDLISLNKDNPTHRALVQEIYDAPDPGGALMDWHANGGAQVHGRGRRMPPSLNSQTRSGSHSARSAPVDMMDGWATGGGWGGADEEQDIFAHATRR